MANPVFELFELICLELRTGQAFVLTERAVPRTLLIELRRRTDRLDGNEALAQSVELLKQHFRWRSSSIPFDYDQDTGIVTPLDQGFIDFVVSAIGIRTRGTQSKEFELSIGRRLRQKLATGAFHNVGWPRGTRRRRAEIVDYLGQLGFANDVLRGRDKDGGLDLLWLPPLGGIPVRPIVTFQCKNSRFSESTIREANSSAVIASRSIHRHTHMKSHGVYLSYIVFNDYFDSRVEDMASGISYAPLGLSDLGSIAHPPSTMSEL